MDDAQFIQELRARGYGDAEIEEVEPGPEREMHTHEFSVMSRVTRGEFTMVLETGPQPYGPGDWCENDAGTLHTERMGPDGVTALVATKQASDS
jgi:quercetin dioxygenase-like cupin family protein